MLLDQALDVPTIRKEVVMSTAANEAVAIEEGGTRKARFGWVLAGLAALAVSIATPIAIEVASSPEAVPAIAKSSPVTSMLYSPDELMVKRLASGGHIPAQTLNAEPFLTKRLVNLSLVPKEALKADSILIQRFVNQGLVPEQAADSGLAEE
jgi:hypothetical protein